MKYCVIDLETSGVDWNNNVILQFSAVVEDSEKPEIPLENLPTFNRYVKWDNFNISLETINFHIKTGFWQRYLDAEKDYLDSILNDFLEFIEVHFGRDGKVVAAGKNLPGFDLRFIEGKDNATFLAGAILRRLHHRKLDFTSSFILPTDSEPPSLKLCLERAGINKEVAHDGLEDCYDVIRLGREVFKRNSSR